MGECHQKYRKASSRAPSARGRSGRLFASVPAAKLKRRTPPPLKSPLSLLGHSGLTPCACEAHPSAYTPPFGQQLRVAARLHHLPLGHHVNHVGEHGGGKPMGNQNRDPLLGSWRASVRPTAARPTGPWRWSARPESESAPAAPRPAPAPAGAIPQRSAPSPRESPAPTPSHSASAAGRRSPPVRRSSALFSSAAENSASVSRRSPNRILAATVSL